MDQRTYERLYERLLRQAWRRRPVDDALIARWWKWYNRTQRRESR